MFYRKTQGLDEGTKPILSMFAFGPADHFWYCELCIVVGWVISGGSPILKYTGRENIISSGNFVCELGKDPGQHLLLLLRMLMLLVVLLPLENYLHPASHLCIGL